MYLECEFFTTSLLALAYFTHKVILPLLKCVKVRGQTDFLTIFPKLYTKLCGSDMNTLNEHSVIQKHLQIKEPDDELGKERSKGKLLKV